MANGDKKSSTTASYTGLSRRDFLKYTTGTAACISLGSFSLGCSGTQTAAPVAGYQIDSAVATTAQKTVTFDRLVSGLHKSELCQVSQYGKYGYGNWTQGPALPHERRSDLMGAGFSYPTGPEKAKLLSFFAITDIHITDKESPSQMIYLQPSNLTGFESFQTSIYSPVMLYTTHVLDAAIQTVNALHKLPGKAIDFGISLGDACNSSQYNELRWYIDVIDGKVITPSSGAHVGADSIDFQKPYQAAGLDKSIPWYQTLGNHDHFWMGIMPVDGASTGDFLRNCYLSDTVIASEDILIAPNALSAKILTPNYYMDGTTPNGDIIKAGPVGSFATPPKVVADPDRRSLLRTEWISEFSKTSSSPVGHGLNLIPAGKESGFACYSFLPKSDIPIKVIVLDNTQMEMDGSDSIHGHGFLDQERWQWLKDELKAGDDARQLMIIAAHVPICVQPAGTFLEWFDNSANPSMPQNAVLLPDLVAELHRHPNLLMWVAGHRHFNTVKALPSPDPAAPEQGFWQVETSSLRDFPQQFRTFEIFLNADYTVSIVTTNVDPAVKEGTPAAKSRQYAVAAQQIVANDLDQNNPNSDPALPAGSKDPSIHPMDRSIFSYNAQLYKKLSPEMIAKLQTLFPLKN